MFLFVSKNGEGEVLCSPCEKRKQAEGLHSLFAYHDITAICLLLPHCYLYGSSYLGDNLWKVAVYGKAIGVVTHSKLHVKPFTTVFGSLDHLKAVIHVRSNYHCVFEGRLCLLERLVRLTPQLECIVCKHSCKYYELDIYGRGSSPTNKRTG